MSHSPDDDASWHPKTVEGLTWTEINGAFMARRPGDPRTHALNATGVLIVELSNGAHSPLEIASLVGQAFNLDAPPVEIVRTFLKEAVEAGIMV